MAISPQYYKETNTVKVFFEGKRSHFLQKERAIVIDKYAYILNYGDDMYSLAARIFGKENQYLWTIIADINELREPTDWEVGETIYLPLLIVNESLVELRKYIDEQSTTAFI